MNGQISGKKLAKIAAIVLIVAVVVVLLLSSFTIVPVGHKGVLMTFGAVQQGTLEEGVNFKIPFVQSVQNVDVRVKKFETDANSSSKDLQEISSTVALNYRIDSGAADQLLKNIGTAYESTIIAPAIAECVKAVTSQYTAEELITKRTSVSAEMKEQLSEKLSDKYIIVDSFNIVNFGFSEQFNKAIEEKQIAEQNALKAKYDLERIKTEAEQEITQAKAEAEALRLKSEQVTMEMIYLEYVQKWDGKMPAYMGGDNMMMMLPGDLSDSSKVPSPAPAE